MKAILGGTCGTRSLNRCAAIRPRSGAIKVGFLLGTTIGPLAFADVLTSGQNKTAMKCTTLIPVRFNDGRKVPLRQSRELVDQLAVEFGGCSDEGVTKGQWLDPKDSVHYRDESRRVTVICDRVLLDEARKAVLRIGRALGQRAMYFEVRDCDGAQILEVPAIEEDR